MDRIFWIWNIEEHKQEESVLPTKVAEKPKTMSFISNTN